MRISDWSSDVCSSDLGGIGAGDEPGRDRRQVIAEAALVLEAGAKPRGGEEVGELRQDAAGQEDAALRAIAQRHVAGEAAEEEAEALEGEAAEIVAAVEAEAGDGAGGERRQAARSEERRGGTEWVSTWRTWWSADH